MFLKSRSGSVENKKKIGSVRKKKNRIEASLITFVFFFFFFLGGGGLSNLFKELFSGVSKV